MQDLTPVPLALVLRVPLVLLTLVRLRWFRFDVGSHFQHRLYRPILSVGLVTAALLGVASHAWTLVALAIAFIPASLLEGRNEDGEVKRESSRGRP
jgi:hypothetical protein